MTVKAAGDAIPPACAVIEVHVAELRQLFAPGHLIWSGPGCLARETIPPIPDDIAALMREVSTAGKYAE